MTYYLHKATQSIYFHVKIHPVLCCGSGSTLIWVSWFLILIGNEETDSGAMQFTSLSKSLFYLLSVFYDLLPTYGYTKYIFHLKIQLY